MNLVEAKILTLAAGRIQPSAVPYHVVDIQLGDAVHAACRLDGRQVSRIQVRGDVDILPAGVEGMWELAAPTTALLLRLSTTLLARTAEALGMQANRLELIPTLQARDPRIMHIGLALHEEFQAGCPGGRIFTESLATALAARLVQGYARTPSRASAPEALQAWRLRRVSEYVDAHLDQDLSLAELAAVAGFSVSHFKPLFKRATGLAVHQYVIERRVARARTLLLTGNKSMSEIALEAGFAHQSHMARWLRRLLGTTPSALVAHRYSDPAVNP